VCQNPAVADLDELKIPKGMRPVAEEIIQITDQVCAQLLDAEYAALARQAVAKLARKRPSPLLSGRRGTWAAAVVYALGQVNFLHPGTRAGGHGSCHGPEQPLNSSARLTVTGALQQHGPFGHISRECGGAAEVGGGLAVAAEPGQQVAADAGQVVGPGQPGAGHRGGQSAEFEVTAQRRRLWVVTGLARGALSNEGLFRQAGTVLAAACREVQAEKRGKQTERA
jgi:hypothetical protein